MKKTLLACLLFACTLMNSQITLGSGTTTGFVPVDVFYGYSYTQQIIPKADLNASGAGNITSLRFYQASSATLANSNDWKIYMGTTTKSSFASTTDWISVSSLTQVFAGTVTAASGVVTITLDIPFNYNNVDNLVIAVDENKAGYETSSASRFYTYAATTNGSLYARNDAADIDPAAPGTGTLYSSRSRMMIFGLTQQFSGACPVVSAPVASATNVSATPTFSWGAVTGATGYRLNIGTQPGATDVVNGLELGNVTTYTLSTPLNYQTQYYYTIVSHDATTSSTGCAERSFTTAPTPPANDACSGALVVSSFPYSYNQTDGATATNNSGFIMNCSLGMNDGLWFKFKGNGGKITVKVTPTGWDPELAVYSGTCGNFTCETSADNGASGGVETVTLTATVLDKDYFVNVGHYSSTVDNPEGPFVIDITTDVVLATNNLTKDHVKIYPNPFTEMVNISDISNVKNISIADFTGRSVKTVKAAKTISLSDLKPGIYILSLNYEDGSVKATKIVKK